MKILDWANKLTRRGFLAGSAATIAAVAVSGPSILSDPATRPAPAPEALAPEDSRTLLKFTRDLFPHDRLEDSFYATAIAPLEGEAMKDATTRRLLSEGLSQLNELAVAAGGKPFADLADERTRVGVIKQIEGGEFFTKVYSSTITPLYNQPELWPKFGYEGPSSPFGGYLHRGFNDLDWL